MVLLQRRLTCHNKVPHHRHGELHCTQDGLCLEGLLPWIGTECRDEVCLAGRPWKPEDMSSKREMMEIKSLGDITWDLRPDGYRIDIWDSWDKYLFVD